MNEESRKMSEIMIEMSERLFRDPEAAHSTEAVYVTLLSPTSPGTNVWGLVPNENEPGTYGRPLRRITANSGTS